MFPFKRCSIWEFLLVFGLLLWGFVLTFKTNLATISSWTSDVIASLYLGLIIILFIYYFTFFIIKFIKNFKFIFKSNEEYWKMVTNKKAIYPIVVNGKKITIDNLMGKQIAFKKEYRELASVIIDGRSICFDFFCEINDPIFIYKKMEGRFNNLGDQDDVKKMVSFLEDYFKRFDFEFTDNKKFEWTLNSEKDDGEYITNHIMRIEIVRVSYLVKKKFTQ